MCKHDFNRVIGMARSDTPDYSVISSRYACSIDVIESRAYGLRLDTCSHIVIVMLTLCSTHRRRCLHGTSPHRRQDAHLARTRLPQPSPRARARPTVPGQRLLRSPRSPAGQVRDAAPCARGRRVRQRQRRPIRVVPPYVLPGATCLRGGRAAGAIAEAARTATAAQAQRRGGRGLARRPGATTAAQFPGTRRTGARAVRPLGAPAQCRARAGAEKKRL